MQQQQQPVKIRMITWNMGLNKKTKTEWKAELDQVWALGEGCSTSPVRPNTNAETCFDLLVVVTQEDWRGKNHGGFVNAIHENLISSGDTSWVSQCEVVLGPPDVFNQPFTVRLCCFYRNQPGQPFYGAQLQKAQVCHKKVLKAFCSKGTAGIALNVPNAGQLILMGSHFPVSPKQASMGYEARVQAIQKSLAAVFGRLRTSFPDAPNVVAMWAGDMNFRRDTPTDENTPSAPEDQLTYAIERGEVGPFVELPLQFPPTCKIHACTDQVCSECQERARTTEEAIEACYDTKRTPSHCDRVLFYVEGQNVSLEPRSYQAWANSPGVFSSDHNLVWADFNLQW